jgi:DNA mismatch repair protein MutS
MPAPKITPAMAQYMHFKRQHNDAILFFRMGDFYEMFYDDAVEAADLLGLTLTSRNHSKSSGSVPLAGVPHHAADAYLAKLVRLGRKVAICEQVEDPKKAKGVVKRDVVQVVSPGTALSDTVLDQQRNNYLVSLHAGEELTGLAVIDLSTSDFTLSELDAADVWGELEILAPAEFLIGERVGEDWVETMEALLPGTAVSRIDDWHFEFNSAYESLTTQLGVRSLKGYDAEDLQAAICAGGAAVDYLRDNQRGAIAHINRIQRKRPDDYLMLDATAQRNLELLANQHDGKREGSLLEVLDQTRTPMGARLLRRWIVSPLRDTAAIVDRQDAVAALLESGQSGASLREIMGGIGDLERVMARICCQRANARDLVGLAVSLRKVEDIRSGLAALHCSLLETLRSAGLPDIQPLLSELSEALVDEPPLHLADGGLIRDGYHEELDELRQTSRGGKEWIAEQQTHERKRSGISSLKIGYNQVFGYYIEVSKANLDRVPEEYVRKQTLANAERYITSELKECEARVLGAEEKIAELEGELFVELRSRAAAWAEPVQQVARTVAQIDVLCSLAEVARRNDYVRPELDTGSVIEISGGRHPVVENLIRDGRFVPNDVLLDCDQDQILLITGPNMAGKSTIIRQVGLIVLMAQMGSYVAAERARIGVVDRIFTRVGAADNLARGESTFMVEMNEASSILNNVTSQSLILMDELGRGTSTFDGLSIAWAVVEFLHGRSQVKPRTLFATHYHELTDLEGQLERVKNVNVLVREDGDKVVFLHRLVEGPCDRSYGIHVAQMAGMPDAVVNRAHEILGILERDQIDRERLSAGGVPQRDTEAENQLQLFDAPGPPTSILERELRQLDISSTSPLDALLKLSEWKKLLEEGDR